jgi:hypothetical protein
VLNPSSAAILQNEAGRGGARRGRTHMATCLGSLECGAPACISGSAPIGWKKPTCGMWRCRQGQGGGHRVQQVGG